MQIGLGQVDGFCKRAVPIQDSEDTAIRTMGRITEFANITFQTGTIDFADDPFTLEFAALCDANELMPKNSLKSHVALDQLQIGFTNAGSQDTDWDLISSFPRDIILSDTNSGRVQFKGAQVYSTAWAAPCCGIGWVQDGSIDHPILVPLFCRRCVGSL